MEDYAEKRQYERHSKKLPISISRSDTPDRYYFANMCNYSKGGMYVQSSEKIEIGKQVYIKIKQVDDTLEEPLRDGQYSGYIRWSDDLGTSSPGGQYGYGVEYMVPADY